MILFYINKFLNKINILIFILFIPYIFFTFSNSIYVPGHDEANQIEAALYFSNNCIFSFSNVIPNDFSSRNFKFQNEWPIGFPILLLLFLKLNIKQFLALKIIKMLLFFSTMFIWNKIISISIKDNIKKNIFVIILFLILILISQSMTDFIVTFLFSIIFYLLQKYHNHYDNYFYHFKISFLIGLAFIFKYSSVFILPSTILYILCFNRVTPYKKLKYIAIHFFIFLLFFIFL